MIETSEKHILTVYIKRQLVSTITLDDFGSQSITLGRSRENDIILFSSIVSVRHGTFERKGDRFSIKDLDSTNGLLINGSRSKEAVLENGDSIRIDDESNPHSEGVLLLYSVLNKNNEEKWSHYILKGSEAVTIGRNSENSLVLKHHSVSKLHARIEPSGTDWLIEDLSSTNGTFVNGQAIDKRTSLKLNDVILIADTKLVFKGDRLSYSSFTYGLGIDAIKLTKNVKEKRGLFKRIGTKTLIDNVNISIKPGELVALVGGSGAGKSTLMDCLNGFRRATGGQVLVNGDDFYANYKAYKSILGYVPQQDIVYDTLTVEEMLDYAAMLRMPADTTTEERRAQVKKIIKSVELEGRESLPIKNLSGGQKKRVSIAVELLAEPKLFFLDEPTSGLDPGMERNIMYLLKNLSNEGKTIILVTHAMANLMLCDKLAFMGKGGKLCYFGTPEGALAFFGVKDFTDIFNMINTESEEWQRRFINSNYYIYHKSLQSKSAESKEAKGSRKASIIKQLLILVRRYSRITLSDRQRFFMLLFQAPFIGFLIGIVSKSDSFEVFEPSRQVLFTLACSAIWIGVLNSIQEICKERTVLKREASVNLRLFPYVVSKILVLGVLSLLQSILLVVVVSRFVTFPDKSFTGSMLLDVTAMTYLVAMAATAMGLLFSAFVTNSDRAMGIAPLLLIPQILFSGVLFKLDGVTKWISYIALSRWAMAGYGMLFDINTLPLKLSIENPGFVMPKRELETMFERSIEGFLQNGGILIIFLIVCAIVGIIALNKSLKEA